MKKLLLVACLLPAIGFAQLNKQHLVFEGLEQEIASDYTSAIASYTKALELDRNHLIAHHNRERLQTLLNNTEKSFFKQELGLPTNVLTTKPGMDRETRPERNRAENYHGYAHHQF